MSLPSSNWAARAFQKTVTNVFYSRVLPSRRRRSRRPAQQISLESLEPRQMLSVNPVSSGSSASSANDSSSIAAFVSQNTIGILAVVPSAPTSVVATSGNASLAVTWAAPASTGGSAITEYLVKYSSNGAAGPWTRFFPSPRLPITASPCTVTGLTNGTAYVIKVIARNAIGLSLPASSAPATPAVTVPSVPTSVVATSGNASLAVTWVAPASNGGSAITTYLVKYSSNGGTAWTNFIHPVSTVPSLTVTGLANGTAYVIKVIARNAIGISKPSANSAPATTQGAALNPTFGSTTSTANGFTVQITNYDSSYTWAGTATASGTVVVSGTGFVTVTNVAANTSSTATITTTKSNTVGGSAPITATSLFFAMSMVTVGNVGNAADAITGSVYGAVSYWYQIGTYDVTGTQYTAFLNAVGLSDPYGLYDLDMPSESGVNRSAQISRSGTYGTYTYAVMNNTGSRPITYVSWFDCARFSNWMSNGQPSGAQNSTTTENGAYNVNGAISGNAVAANATNPNTGAVPTYRIPLENEWYKAAYYSPNYGGTGIGGYYAYATQSDTPPGTTIGSSANQANFNSAFGIGTATDVGAFSSSGSLYGTFDQSGNVFQWNDQDGTAGPYRGLRGGYWYSDAPGVSSQTRHSFGPSYKIDGTGFRLASPVTLIPTFGATSSTANGFTVQITNYNALYTWAGTATASGSVVVSGTGLVTVTGVAPGTSSTATITTTRTGYTVGSATVTASSWGVGTLTPTFGATSSTADGFFVQITNYDSSYTWAGTATASGLVAISGTGLVTVTNVAAVTSVTATITTAKSNTVGGTANVTAFVA